jgi:hypothetical protein
LELAASWLYMVIVDASFFIGSGKLKVDGVLLLGMNQGNFWRREL